ncbi:hypothetical protein [Roseobacter ponti]|uniref:Lipoprotein n=1 Tax=Roseobacter ponti TaxID=1891787 RepID=A0A858STB0_9RHOB|nr:hypothetical protein [Roseobacter ponti]QJF51237.1 hypothetical protein G3256_08720 [Roseobacter ponti]
MFRNRMAVIWPVLLLAASGGQAQTTDADRQSLLSCKFGPACTRDNVECAEYARWIILRYYETEERFALFDALQSSEQEALVREMGAMTIFEIEEIGDGEGRFGSSFRMVVGPTLEAAVQSVSVSREDESDLTFLPEALNGMCRVIE